MAICANHLNITFHVGDTVRVYYRIIEKDIVSGKTKKEKHEEQKERVQAYEGIVLAIRGKNEGKSIIVRHMGVGNIGVERIFPLNSPWIKKITLKKTGSVRRAKLYYLRHQTGKAVAKLGELVKEEISPKTDLSKKTDTAASVKAEKTTVGDEKQPAKG